MRATNGTINATRRYRLLNGMIIQGFAGGDCFMFVMSRGISRYRAQMATPRADEVRRASPDGARVGGSKRRRGAERGA